MLECKQQLLQALREERTFFRSGGYGSPYRSEWRPTLLFRDSPTCVNFSSAGALNACEECPLFRLVPGHKRNDAIPCHHIVLDAEGNTIAGLYRKGSQHLLDDRYEEWLTAVIAGLEQWLQAVCLPNQPQASVQPPWRHKGLRSNDKMSQWESPQKGASE